jgi:hypothetical protein
MLTYHVSLYALLLQFSRTSVAAFVNLVTFHCPHRQRSSSSKSLLKSSQTRGGVHQELQPQQHAGIPAILSQLPCGDSILGFRNHGQHNVTVERVAVSPPIFILRNFISALECDAILQSISTCTEAPAQTALGLRDEITRKKSFVSWLGMDAANGTVRELAKAGRQLMLIPARSLGVEDLQVVRYESSGEYTLHHDGHDRVLTLLYYLNGEGETWFPLARQRDVDSGNNSIPRTLQDALDATAVLQSGIDGILVSSSCS